MAVSRPMRPSETKNDNQPLRIHGGGTNANSSYTVHHTAQLITITIIIIIPEDSRETTFLFQ